MALTESGDVSVYSVADGAASLDETTSTVTSISGRPSFSSDGNQIAVVAKLFGTSENVFVYAIDGGGTTLTVRNAIDPAFSPSAPPELVCVSSAGSAVETFKPPAAPDGGIVAATLASSPAWDPANTKQFAFIDSQTLKVAGDPLQGDSTDIPVSSAVVAFSWGPSGDELAFISSSSGACALETSSVSGGTASSPSVLVKGLACGSAPDTVSWSPDGSHIAFSHAQGVYSVPPTSPGVDVSSLTQVALTSNPVVEVGWTNDSAWTLFLTSSITGLGQLGYASPSSGGGLYPTFSDGGSLAGSFEGFAISPQ